MNPEPAINRSIDPNPGSDPGSEPPIVLDDIASNSQIAALRDDGQRPVAPEATSVDLETLGDVEFTVPDPAVRLWREISRLRKKELDAASKRRRRESKAAVGHLIALLIVSVWLAILLVTAMTIIMTGEVTAARGVSAVVLTLLSPVVAKLIAHYTRDE